MNLTKNDIATVRVRLRQEITERECLLAAVELFEKYATSGLAPDSINLGGLLSTLLPGRRTLELKELKECTPPPAPAALPEKPREKAYIHPELEALLRHRGSIGRAVSWAIQRMTEDYTVGNIAALLQREGTRISSAEVSVVLTRFKNRGEIEQITPGRGRRPAIFRGPAGGAVEETAPAA